MVSHQLLFALLSASDCSTTPYAQKLKPCDNLTSLTTFIEYHEGAYDLVKTPLNTGGNLVLFQGHPLKSEVLLSPNSFGLCYLRLVPPCLYREFYLHFGWAPFHAHLVSFFDVWMKSLPRDTRFDELQVHLETPGLTPQEKAYGTLHIRLSSTKEQLQLESLTPREILKLNLPVTMQVGADTSLMATNEFTVRGFVVEERHRIKVISDTDRFGRRIRRTALHFPCPLNTRTLESRNH